MMMYYDEILTKLNASNPDYFNPEETNQQIEKIAKRIHSSH